ncbi:MAG: hypothetical protein IJ678_02620, partial [Kiritimatiellae bacterium]|nr:hypothetical protein [Kiritimatiellia bacterium]
MKITRTAFLASAAAAALLSCGCATRVLVKSEPEGAWIRYRGEGRATFRWKSAPTAAPADLKLYYGRVSAYAIWPDGSVSDVATVPLSASRPVEEIVLRPNPALPRRPPAAAAAA